MISKVKVVVVNTCNCMYMYMYVCDDNYAGIECLIHADCYTGSSDEFATCTVYMYVSI